MGLASLARGIEGGAGAAVLYGSLLAGTTLVAARAARGNLSLPGPFRTLHAALPLVVLPAVFTGIRFLGPAAAPPGRLFDDALADLDRRWLGVDVASWSERILTPGLADGMMVFYALYFLMPVALFGAVLVRGDRNFLYRAAFTVSLGLYASYALYILVPAAGPRHAYVGRSAPLPEGLLTGTLHDFIRDLEPQPYDAFPSAHVVLGLLCAVFAWRMGGWIRWAMAVAAAGTVLSTVFLRYHYVVDDLAGLAVLAFALGAEAALARRAARRPAAGAHDDRLEEMLRSTEH